MNFTLHDRNGAFTLLHADYASELAELELAIRQAEYQMQMCGEKGRTNEMIFSPSLSNDSIKQGLISLGWEHNVRLLNPTPESGRDVDYYKRGIAVEVQFAHYGLCVTDISRLERLFTGDLALRPGTDGRTRPVEVGVSVVVEKAMPTSQGVSNLDQLTTRAATLAASIPLLMVGIVPPGSGETVMLHELVPRSRRSLSMRRVPWP